MRKAYGFTIVELLIVIVVIAILASLSYVAYTNIQSRAQLAVQIADLDKIGKAIQLWSAENGTSLRNSGAGNGGTGIGYFTIKNNTPYTSISVEDLLRNSGYLTGEISAFPVSSVMVTPCTDGSSPRWVVLATVSPAPSRPVAEQIAETGCTNAVIAGYASGSYSRNLLKAY